MNFIHLRDFFPDSEAENCFYAVENLSFSTFSEYGIEIPQFNLVFPDLDMVVGKMLGDFINIDSEISGVFRKPFGGMIHFESFTNLKEWRMIVALEDTTFKVYRHKSGIKNALELTEESNVIWMNNAEDETGEWEEETVIKLRQNDAIFFRPWIFHSLDHKIILSYTLQVE